MNNSVIYVANRFCKKGERLIFPKTYSETFILGGNGFMLWVEKLVKIPFKIFC